MSKEKEFTNIKPSQDLVGPDYTIFTSESVVSDIIDDLKGKEVFEEYGEHQSFVLSGMDEREEFKSRMAFVDAYKDEFAKVHERVKDFYRNRGDKNEFDYLTAPDFRKVASSQKRNVTNPLKIDNFFLLDMMKDYMTYQHLMGKVSTANYNAFLEKEPEKEKAFRKQSLEKKDRDFLIEESPFSDEKKKGIRECRKWMYRNASKSGAFNETGSKRNYIDSFAKRPVNIQVNTLYQIEKGLYKYAETTGINEKLAMSADYVPNFAKFKDKMVRKKRNPYNLYKKAVGEFYYWTRLERAVKKSDARKDIIDLHYREASLENKLNGPAGKLKEPEGSARSKRYRIVNPVGDASEVKKVNNALKEFGEARDKYLELLDKFQKDRTDNSIYKKLIKQGNKLQRFVKVTENKEALERAERILGKENAISSFVDFTVEIQKNRKISNAKIEKMKSERANDGIDIALTVKGLGDKGYSLGSGVAGMVKTTKTLEKVSRGFSFGTAVTSAFSTVKNAFLTIVSWRRRNKAEEVQKENEKLKSDQNNAPDIERRKLNEMAKISKNRNDLKTKNYATQGGFAAAGVGFTVMGLAGLACLPLTIVGGAVGAIGVGIKYAMDYYDRKKIAAKALDGAMKTEAYSRVIGDNNDIRPEGKASADHKKYIDIKAEERKKILEEKQGRFTDNQSSWKTLDKYTHNPDMIKNRVRDNWAVEKGCLSIYSFSDYQNQENIMDAYRHMFLKDPEGPIDENNLLTPAQVKQYMSTEQPDLDATGQTKEQARRRALYKDVLKSEGIKTAAPENLKEAKKRMRAKEKPVENAAEAKKGKSL